MSTIFPFIHILFKIKTDAASSVFTSKAMNDLNFEIINSFLFLTGVLSVFE